MFTEELDFLSATDLEWIMGRGLAECLGWPEVLRADQLARPLEARPRVELPARQPFLLVPHRDSARESLV